MSLVDPYHDRVFSNGRVYGVNYDEQTMRPTYSDVSPFGGQRKAGEGIGLDHDVVIYMGKAAQGMPQIPSVDEKIANAFLSAIMGVVPRPENRTLEYRPERDFAEARTMEYVPSRDDAGVELLADGTKEYLAGGNFMGGMGSQITPRPTGLKGISPDALKSLPNSDIAREKYMKIRQGINLPRV